MLQQNSLSNATVAGNTFVENYHQMKHVGRTPSGKMSGLSMADISQEAPLAKILTRWMNSFHLKDFNLIFYQ